MKYTIKGSSRYGDFSGRIIHAKNDEELFVIANRMGFTNIVVLDRSASASTKWKIAALVLPILAAIFGAILYVRLEVKSDAKRRSKTAELAKSETASVVPAPPIDFDGTECRFDGSDRLSDFGISEKSYGISWRRACIGARDVDVVKTFDGKNIKPLRRNPFLQISKEDTSLHAVMRNALEKLSRGGFTELSFQDNDDGVAIYTMRFYKGVCYNFDVDWYSNKLLHANGYPEATRTRTLQDTETIITWAETKHGRRTTEVLAQPGYEAYWYISDGSTLRDTPDVGLSSDYRFSLVCPPLDNSSQCGNVRGLKGAVEFGPADPTTYQALSAAMSHAKDFKRSVFFSYIQLERKMETVIKERPLMFSLSAHVWGIAEDKVREKKNALLRP